MSHAEILAAINSLISQAGDGMQGYGFMRVLETLIQIAQDSANPLIALTRSGLDSAMLDASNNGPFHVIDVRDHRSFDQLSAEILGK